MRNAFIRIFIIRVDCVLCWVIGKYSALGSEWQTAFGKYSTFRVRQALRWICITEHANISQTERGVNPTMSIAPFTQFMLGRESIKANAIQAVKIPCLPVAIQLSWMWVGGFSHRTNDWDADDVTHTWNGTNRKPQTSQWQSSKCRNRRRREKSKKILRVNCELRNIRSWIFNGIEFSILLPNDLRKNIKSILWILLWVSRTHSGAERQERIGSKATNSGLGHSIMHFINSLAQLYWCGDFQYFGFRHTPSASIGCPPIPVRLQI